MKLIITFSVITAASICLAQRPLDAKHALELASKHRPALQAAKLNIEQARSSGKAQSAISPITFGIGATSRGELGSNDQDLFLSQSIDLFGRRNANKLVGNAAIQIALAEYYESATNLQNEVLTAFSQAVAAKHQKDVADQLLSVSTTLHVATKRRFEEGKIAEIQLIRATIELERATQAAEIRSRDLTASTMRLAGVLGVDAKDLVVQSNATIEPLNNPNLEFRFDLLLLKSKVQEAEASAEIARVSRRPELGFQVIRSPWGSASGVFAGRVQLTWAIFDHGKSKNETEAALARAQASRKLLEDASLLAQSEIEAAQLEVLARQNRIKSYESILASVRDLMTKAQKGYSEGFGTQIDVLEATRALREVEQEMMEAKQQLSLAVIAQYRATGFLAEVLK